jgi:hypothetical protein
MHIDASQHPEPAMRARNLDRRLDAATGRVCDRAYARFARLVSAREAMTTEDQDEAARLFRMLTDLEVRRGTPAEAMLARFPREFADALRAALRRLLDARKQGRKRPRSAS